MAFLLKKHHNNTNLEHNLILCSNLLGGEVMKKFSQWIYSNKVTLTGFIALILYFLDQIFAFSKDLELSQEVYYGIASLIILIIGYAIRGRGFESVEEFKAVIEKKRQLKAAKTIVEKMDVIENIINE